MNNKPPYYIKSSLASMNVEGKTVLLRTDLNTPIKDGMVLDNFRLQAIQPTLKLLLEKGAQVLLITHIGRPKKHDETLSTKHLLPWFQKNNYDITFAPTIETAQNLLNKHARLILFENIRFWAEKDSQQKLALELKSMTDFYVMDAFGVAHRNDIITADLPKMYPANHRTIGFCIEKELTELNKLLTSPEQPFLMILGGAKAETKLPLIENLLENIETCALLPTLSFTFQRSLEIPTGTSLVNNGLLSEAKKTLAKAKNLGKEIILPQDYLVATGWNEKTDYRNYDKIKPNEMGLSIGPKTVAEYTTTIKNAKTIFINGLSGDIAYPHTLSEIKAMCASLCVSSAYKIAAGGDTIAIIKSFSQEKCFDFLSTGGGATLSYLSKQILPGLQSFIK